MHGNCSEIINPKISLGAKVISIPAQTKKYRASRDIFFHRWENSKWLLYAARVRSKKT